MGRRALFVAQAPGLVLARGIALTLALGVAGCTTLPPADDRAPPLRALPGVAPNFDVPDARARMLSLARQEWALFGSPVVDENDGAPRLEFRDGVEAAHEVQPEMLARVLMYWYDVTGQPIVGEQGELRPWSAVFISWLAKSAGHPAAAFPRTALHWDYIERAIEAGAGARFVARDLSSYAPKPGDLVCAPRGEAFVASIPDFAAARRGPWHCDLVVALRPGLLEAIGGNVLDAVAMTRVPLDADGRVRPSARRPWRVILEQR